MAKKKWLHKILAILPSISLIVILLISSFEIGAYGDWNFYEKEYEKYKVADELYGDAGYHEGDKIHDVLFAGQREETEY